MTAVVNVAVLAAGYGLIELVAATTVVRLADLFPLPRQRLPRLPGAAHPAVASFRRARLREVTSFSVYVLDHRLGEQAELLDRRDRHRRVPRAPRGRGLDRAASALAEMTQRLTNQLNGVLFPAVVDSDAGSTNRIGCRRSSSRARGSRWPASSRWAASMMLLAAPLVAAWVGPEFAGSVLVAPAADRSSSSSASATPRRRRC